MPGTATDPELDARLRETQRAFDSIASLYDGPRGNNAILKRMRRDLWRAVEREVPPGGHLLDLGCGPGIDAEHLASRGYRVTAIDWSPRMVEETLKRAKQAGLEGRMSAHAIGIHELDALVHEQFDGIYSDFGPLNCVPDLEAVARACAGRLRPGCKLIVSVMGRVVPWERLYYTLRGDLDRARVRDKRSTVPVGLNRHTVWTAYYTPQEFYGYFKGGFALSSYRGLGLFLPPPYLVDAYERTPRVGSFLGWLDDQLAGLPLLRDAGDHFLMVMTRLAEGGRS